MNKVEILGKRIEIYKAKMLLFVAIAGGSWVYALKLSENFFAILLLLVFIVSAIGIFTNISKLSNLDKELKGLDND
jgi:hypothetical protein